MITIFVVLALIVAHPFLTMFALLFTGKVWADSRDRQLARKWDAEAPARMAEARRRIHGDEGLVDGK